MVKCVGNSFVEGRKVADWMHCSRLTLTEAGCKLLPEVTGWGCAMRLETLASFLQLKICILLVLRVSIDQNAL
jgi:hypothetical protein